MEDLTSVSGVGAVVGESIANYFASSGTGSALNDLIEVGVTLSPSVADVVAGGGGPLSGEIVVVTGTLAASGLSRREAQDRIRAAGGVVADAITSKTTLLVAGRRRGVSVPMRSDSAFASWMRRASSPFSGRLPRAGRIPA